MKHLLFFVFMSISLLGKAQKSTYMYVSFPKDVNKIIDDFYDHLKDKKMTIELSNVLDDSSCTMMYRAILTNYIPTKAAWALYVSEKSSNIYYKSGSTLIKVTNSDNSRFQTFLKYPVSDVHLSHHIQCIIYFTAEKLIDYEYNRYSH